MEREIHAKLRGFNLIGTFTALLGALALQRFHRQCFSGFAALSPAVRAFWNGANDA